MSSFHSISNFIAGFNGGTRSNRFKVLGEISSKSKNTNTTLTNFHVRASSVPSAAMGAIPINYRGRTVNYPGDRVYQPWEMVVLDDISTGSGKSLFYAFHQWQKDINDHVTNLTSTTGNANPSNHFAASVWTVQQLDTNGANAIRSFKLHNCWPVYVGPLELDMAQDNTLNTFTVTMVYSHFEIDETLTK
jgi:hypothetical protein